MTDRVTALTRTVDKNHHSPETWPTGSLSETFTTMSAAISRLRWHQPAKTLGDKELKMIILVVTTAQEQGYWTSQNTSALR
jgi:hypothetical protein